MEHVLPFGKHRGLSLCSVPTDYLAWLLRACKLSTGLRAAIRAELSSRADAPKELPAEPPPMPPPACPRCGSRELRATWHEQRGGRKAIRGSCAVCGSRATTLPMTPANIAAADAAQPTADALDALLEKHCDQLPATAIARALVAADDTPGGGANGAPDPFPPSPWEHAWRARLQATGLIVLIARIHQALNRAEGGVLPDEAGPALGPQWAQELSVIGNRLRAVADALDAAVP